MSKAVQPLSLESLDGWETLTKTEQNTIISEDLAAQEARQNESKAKFSLGKHLACIRSILEPKRVWVQYVRERSKMSVATAYRYIRYYEVMSEKLPKPAINAILQLGVTIPIKAMESSRPLKSSSAEDISKFIEKMNRKKSNVVAIDSNPDLVMKHLLNEFIHGWEKLPKTPRVRAAFLNTFIGMLMTQCGITNPKQFEPVAITEEMRTLRGRPKKAA